MKNLLFLLFLSLVCSCNQTSDKATRLIVVDVAKEHPSKEICLQDIADDLQEEDNPVLMILKFKK